MPVNRRRHAQLFRHDLWADRLVDVIGAGSIGSKVYMELAALGVHNVRVWDGDTVEEHNVPNQAFGHHSPEHSDIGHNKAGRLHYVASRRFGDEDVSNHRPQCEHYAGQSKLGAVVFVCTDSMSSRSEIWHKSVKLKPYVRWYIECRMGVDNGRVYTVNPMRPGSIRAYEATLYSDEEADVLTTNNGCGAAVSIGATSTILAGMAVWQFLRAANAEITGCTDAIEWEILWAARQPYLEAR